MRQHALAPVRGRRAVGFGHGWERRRSTLEAHRSALCACRRNQRGRYAEGDELLSPAAPVPVVVRGGLDAHRVEDQAPHQPLCVLTFQASSCDGRRGGVGDRLGRRRHPVKARVADSGARAARRCYPGRLSRCVRSGPRPERVEVPRRRLARHRLGRQVPAVADVARVHADGGPCPWLALLQHGLERESRCGLVAVGLLRAGPCGVLGVRPAPRLCHQRSEPRTRAASRAKRPSVCSGGPSRRSW